MLTKKNGIETTANLTHTTQGLTLSDLSPAGPATEGGLGNAGGAVVCTPHRTSLPGPPKLRFCRRSHTRARACRRCVLSVNPIRPSAPLAATALSVCTAATMVCCP